jgi:putative transposase
LKDRLDAALDYHRIIAPLLDERLEEAERSALREGILKREGISDRTLRRLIEKFKNDKLEGLKPKQRSDKGAPRAIPAEVMTEAIKLREELPNRSIRRIIEILVLEGIIKPGEIAPTTLGRNLRKMGYSSGDFKLKNDKGLGSRRFEKPQKGMLWQADVKFGPSLPEPDALGKTGKKQKTYLLAFIDDATRLILHGEFYFHQRLPILEDCFRKALVSYGTPDAVYIDNGKIFVSRWFRAACAHLNIKHLAAASYSPQSKGKIERFNRTVGEFLEELRLEPVETLNELNRKFRLWLEEVYHKRPHSSLALNEGTGKHLSPRECWEKDLRSLRTITPEECRTAFLWEEERKVDKTGCLQLCGLVFEAGVNFIGKKVEVHYDPFDLSQVEIWKDGTLQVTAKHLHIGEYNGRKRTNANAIADAPKTGSRLLKSIEKKKKETLARKQGVISYRKLSAKGAQK